jgi:hypothetical protein
MPVSSFWIRQRVRKVKLAVSKIEGWIANRRNVIEVLAHVEERIASYTHDQQRYFKDIALKFGARAIYNAFEKDGTLLISESSSALLPHGMFEKKLIDKVRVFGKMEPVSLYAPQIQSPETADSEHTEVMVQSRNAVEMYLQGDFESAIAIINELKQEFRTPHLEVLLERCQGFLEQAPARWDGVFTLTHK